MRLLHTRLLRLEVFLDEVPPYAILSHTWGEKEITFHDFTASMDSDRTGDAWQKIYNACYHAAHHGWEYIWIDTCCIDKNDITELSEAINSMFRWYEAAEVCYAYLADVTFPNNENDATRGVDFHESRWFTRGWTLQELLAPPVLEFLDSEWNPIGSRDDWAAEIQEATGIRRQHLTDFHRCCIATKLSWAANRLTTRIEDHSYSLLGLLGVYMPLIYGEGNHAFTRLQHELVRKYNDESVLAWTQISGNSDSSSTSKGLDLRNAQNLSYGAVLAYSPRNFKQSVELETHRYDRSRLRFEMTNAGLGLRAEVFMNDEIFGVQHPIYLIRLNCSYVGRASPIVLILRDAESDTSSRYSPTVDSSRYFPVTFRKLQLPALDLQTAVASMGGQWVSCGLHDIIIVDEKTVPSAPGPITSSKPFCFLRQREDEWYQFSEFRLMTKFGCLQPPTILPPIGRPPAALQPNQACMFIMTVRANTEELRPIQISTEDTHYLMILKSESRGLICGIWDSPEDNQSLYDSIGGDLSGLFPTRAPGPTPETELQVLVSKRLGKDTGVSYTISIRRRVLGAAQRRSVRIQDSNELHRPRYITNLVEILFKPFDHDTAASLDKDHGVEEPDMSEDVRELLSYKPDNPEDIKKPDGSAGATVDQFVLFPLIPHEVDILDGDDHWDFDPRDPDDDMSLDDESSTALIEMSFHLQRIGAAWSGPIFIPPTQGTILEGR
ncbi:heterokaryon incompatibility protein-domain-containing protein [Sordaria brevicollis]|uniref:Heterokaryon incompatibility protein-domain-containing protein n=1 Tax=Sordaria brevicollis TaxID=83679 RepID=A0AAE0UF46_SORBR|nr:heterokaryon incompatibility protein-domain-containing protein [Sordaria brevicollis]